MKVAEHQAEPSRHQTGEAAMPCILQSGRGGYRAIRGRLRGVAARDPVAREQFLRFLDRLARIFPNVAPPQPKEING